MLYEPCIRQYVRIKECLFLKGLKGIQAQTVIKIKLIYKGKSVILYHVALIDM